MLGRKLNRKTQILYKMVAVIQLYRKVFLYWLTDL